MTKQRNERGAALLLALGALVILTLLGSAWLQYMVNVDTEADLDIQRYRARQYARAGFEAAVGELRRAQRVAETPRGTLEFSLPYYTLLNAANARTSENFSGKVSVEIIDESAKININHATPQVLQAVLGVDGQTARAIRAYLMPEQGGRWLSSARDLATRGLLNEEQFRGVNAGLITVYSVADHSAPHGFINVNTASPEVLAAALGVSVEKAAQIAQMRSFTDVATLSQAAGLAPTQFNYPSVSDAELPAELSFTSRCYRIVSRGALATAGRKAAVGRTLEAVVIMNADGTATIQYWSEGAERIEFDAPAAEANAPA